MLVLKRKNGESIQIHTQDKHVIYLTVNKIGNGQVKTGIDAQA